MPLYSRKSLARTSAYCISAMALTLTSTHSIAQEAEDKAPIIVTGRSLDDTLKNLEDCIARGCPPNEDIDATLAHAENLFVNGDYKDSSKFIRDSIQRNKKHSAQYPVPVSDLYRSSSRVSEHLGEGRDYYLSVLDMRDILKKHLEKDDSRVLAAEIEVAESRFKVGYPDEAVRKYKKIYEQALEQDDIIIAGSAKIRELGLYVIQATNNKSPTSVKKARTELNEFIANPLKNGQPFQTAAKIMLARLDRSLGDDESTDALIAELAATMETRRPVLLESKPIVLKAALARQGQETRGGSVTQNLAVENFTNRWADIGFWVNDKGTVEDIEILRVKGNKRWISDVTDSIKTRVYAPTRNEEDGKAEGQYIVERYTYTSNWNRGTANDNLGSRIRQRSGVPIIRRLDLTEYPDEPIEEEIVAEDSAES